MAFSSGAKVEDVVSGGIGLAFIAFPKIISSLGAGGDLFGFLFFASLTVAGITSMVLMLLLVLLMVVLVLIGLFLRISMLVIILLI